MPSCVRYGATTPSTWSIGHRRPWAYGQTSQRGRPKVPTLVVRPWSKPNGRASSPSVGGRSEDLSPKAHALVGLLLLNGLRVGEALGANVQDLETERDHRVLRVRRKGGQRVAVPLADPTAAALDTLIGARRRGPVFLGSRGTHTTGRLTPAGAAYLIRKVAHAAGVNTLSPHSLRHGFVTLALEAGATLTDVQDAAGHADPRTTRRYDRARHRLEHAPTLVAEILGRAKEFGPYCGRSVGPGLSSLREGGTGPRSAPHSRTTAR